MSTRRRGWYSNNNFSKNIKDYIVPIIWWILILFLIWSLFFKKAPEKIDTENQVWILITKDADSKATISYTWWNKKDVEDGAKLFKWEKITVASWRVKINNEDFSFNLNKLWELKYLEGWDFGFYSGEAWLDTKSAMNLNMNFAKLKISEGSHISLSQNELISTIYVISWKVEVSNLKWRSTILSSMDKLEVSKDDASNEKVDFSIKKEPISESFIKSDWFMLNNWDSYISINTWTTEESSTGTTSTTSTWETIKTNESFSWKSKYITFSNLLDESNVSSSSILVSWAYDVEEVSKIELNWKIATLNPQTWTFRIEWISVPNKSNDLVFKVFNKDEDLKEKFVYTVYYDSWVNNNSNNNSSSSSIDSWFKVSTFDVDGTKFSFTSPTTSSTYTSYEDFITIRGYVSASWITTVLVNDFKLNSFDWRNWRYHARTDYGNLANWTNVYEIKYFSWNDLVYKNYFTIIKKSWASQKNIKNNTEENTSSWTWRTAD